jgi:hypothetical protein
VHDGLYVGKSAELGDGRGVVDGVGTQASDAETIVATGEGSSSIAGAKISVCGDEAIAIDDDVAARHDRGDGALLCPSEMGSAEAEEECRAQQEESPGSRGRIDGMRGLCAGNDGVTSRLTPASACPGARQERSR